MSTVTAQAITVKDCPSNLSISIQDFQALSTLKESDYKYFERPEETIASYENMKKMDDLELNVKLKKTESSKCYYSDESLDEDFYLRVVLSGSLKKGAKSQQAYRYFGIMKLKIHQ